MSTTTSIRAALAVLAVAAGALLPASASAQSVQPAWQSGQWRFAASIYGWLPTIDQTINFPRDLGSSDIHLSKGDVLDHLKMTFQGSFEAHNGRWGLYTDLLYMDLGGSKSSTREFSIGGIELPASTTTDLSFDLKGLVWTLAGEYRVATDPAWTVDLLAGARLLKIKPTLNYSINGDLGPISIPGRSGAKKVSESYWDGIVGLKGRYAFGDDRRWFAPFYVDVGTGQTKFTWQAAAGLGYAYHWGEVYGMWRYLDYNNKSGEPVEDMSFNGPQLGVTFRW